MCGRYTEADASDAALYLERDPRPPACAVAQSLSFVAARDLHRGQNDADRFPGILGISMDGAQRSLALFEMDGQDGSLCPSKGQALLAVYYDEVINAEAAERNRAEIAEKDR